MHVAIFGHHHVGILAIYVHSLHTICGARAADGIRLAVAEAMSKSSVAFVTSQRHYTAGMVWCILPSMDEYAIT